MRRLALVSAWGALFASAGCERQDTYTESTYFDRKIAPVLQASCAKSGTGSGCHVTADERGNALGNLDVSSYAMLSKRRDLLVDYGPYGMPQLLVKAIAP